jgi:hypothetical protein
VAAFPIEEAISLFLQTRFENDTNHSESLRDLLARTIVRIELRKSCLRLTLATENSAGDQTPPETIDLPWTAKPVPSKLPNPELAPCPKPKLLNAIVRAHAWVRLLRDGTYDSIDDLARTFGSHPNFVRHAIRAAFIDPDITERILSGTANDCLLLCLRGEFGVDWQGQRQLFS